MIYTVTFNPALDYILNVQALSSNDIIRAEKEELNVGGKGINVSVILSRLGIENSALGFLAGFSGKQIEHMLKEEKIATDFVYIKTGYSRINVKIKTEKEIDINASGPEISEEDVDLLFSKLENIKSGDYLVLAGSVPNSLPDDMYERIMKKFCGKNIHFVVDAEKDLLKNVLKYKPFLIKPNHHELREIFSAEINTTEDVIYYAKKLQEMGAKNVLVSRAKDGATLVDENGNVFSVGNVPGKIVSSVGCGDSMVAGFLAGYIQTHDYAEALELGAACGNATAFSSSLAAKNEIEHMLLSQYIKAVKESGNNHENN